MNETVIRLPWRRIAPAAFALAASLTAADAQQANPGPGGVQRNPACVRLEGQLTGLDRGNVDPARAEQIKRYEDTARSQQAEIDRLSAQARRNGCEGRGLLSLFGGQPPQCGPIANQIQQMRANLDKVLADLQQLQGNSADREGQRRVILTQLAQNDCGPQYRAYANRGATGFFESLFGGGVGSPGAPGAPPEAGVSDGSTYRTVCVRTCDGYYFPVSYSTTPANFQADAQTCQRMCPASETALYSYRNPGEDVAQALSSEGRPYSELPTAFAYRKAFNAACSCKGAGQSWRDALRDVDDQTVDGDIVVSEERAKQLSQPVDAKGRPVAPKAAPKGKAAETPAAAAPAPVQNGEPGKRSVRTVGPTFLPSN